MSDQRPNVVLLVADDLGWRDLGCYGSPFYETPNLDLLARDGVRFTDAYASAPVCSPTRASIQTGQYPARVGITDWIDVGGSVHPQRGRLIEAPYEDGLPDDVITLPETLSAQGYDTWHVGKWHLGGADANSLPRDCGFDVNVGGYEAGHPESGYFGPWDNPQLSDGADEEAHYLPERLATEALDLLEANASEADPFFLHYAPYLVHTPLEARESAVRRYDRKREKLGLGGADEIEVGDRFPTERLADGRIKRRREQSHPVYAAMVEALDRAVGRLLTALEANDLAEETIVVFTSDNGGLATSEGSPTTNRPLRDGKGWVYEGGNRVPLVIHWPGVTDQPGAPAVCEEPVTSPDLYQTVRRMAGDTSPMAHDVDGVDLMPLLEGGNVSRECLFWHYPHYGNQGGSPASVLRRGEWKLIEFLESGHRELYNLEEDPREERDLIDHREDLARRLHDRLVEWRRSVGASMPRENPEFEPWEDRATPGDPTNR
jgi:arylsulfatase A-like enzyme